MVLWNLLPIHLNGARIPFPTALPALPIPRPAAPIPLPSHLNGARIPFPTDLPALPTSSGSYTFTEPFEWGENSFSDSFARFADSASSG